MYVDVRIPAPIRNLGPTAFHLWIPSRIANIAGSDGTKILKICPANWSGGSQHLGANSKLFGPGVFEIIRRSESCGVRQPTADRPFGGPGEIVYTYPYVPPLFMRYEILDFHAPHISYTPSFTVNRTSDSTALYSAISHKIAPSLCLGWPRQEFTRDVVRIDWDF